MADLIVNGGKPLSGTITPSGNKNSVLPILCATLLTDEPVTLRNVPTSPISRSSWVLRRAGLAHRVGQGRRHDAHRPLHLRRRRSGELPAGMRSTVLLFAPLLQRMKKITIAGQRQGLLARHPRDRSAPGDPEGARRRGQRRPAAHDRPAGGFRKARATGRLHVGHRHGEFRHGRGARRRRPPHQRRQRAARAGPLRRARRHGREDRGPRHEHAHASTGVEALHGGTFTINTDYHEVVTFLALGAITGGEVR
jgi:UDP-N-acetylglucosamine 1-carboxyvinyltransferase